MVKQNERHLMVPSFVQHGAFQATAYQGRPYKLYVPQGYQHGVATPLFVVLHGCSQNPDDIAQGTRFNQHAEEHGFLVLYPQQTTEHNPRGCWNWFQREHQQRSRGEPAAIVALIQHVQRSYTIDEGRIYAVGISAGGAMAVILAATYPDVFAAIGVAAAVPYRVAQNTAGALAAMKVGSNNPLLLELVYRATPASPRVVPLILFHGTADRTVSPINAQLLINQWLATSRLLTTGSGYVPPRLAGVSSYVLPSGRSYTHRVYEGTDGDILLEAYLIAGLGHAWSGGSPAGSFTDADGPDASFEMTRFCLAHPQEHATPIISIDLTPPVAVEREPTPVREVAPAVVSERAEPEPTTEVPSVPALPRAPSWWHRVRRFGAQLGGRGRRLVRRLFGRSG